MFTPRRATKGWLEGAPEFILDCFDNGGKTADRYTILLGGTLLEPRLRSDRKVYFLGLSDDPSHPLGISMWGEVSSSWRPFKQRVRWLDLPEHIRRHIVARVTG